MTLYDELHARGFIQQVSDEAALRKILSEEKITCYIGFDPTATSLHVGNLLQIKLLMHLQRAGHRPIALSGSGTTMIGDPSGRTELRQMLTREQIQANSEKIRAQLSRFISFENGRALLEDNAEWLLPLNYIEFLRDIGRHFSVNRMLAAEAYKARLENGLSFIEFNYQLLQAYDFLILHRRHGCVLQMGGNDQWGNILAGVELVRRVEGKEVFALTTPLLTTATGAKMGKTAKGALWLDSERVSPYDFYQYWINVDDRDVVKLLYLYTFLPLEEIEQFKKLEGAELRRAKEVLAFEVTSIVHGRAQAEKERAAARALYGEAADASEENTVKLPAENFKDGMRVIDLFHAAGLAATKSEARRLLVQGGCYINRRRIESIEESVMLEDFEENHLLLRAGKKRYKTVVLQ
ncbi:tyrosine--tRNA ligase [candidate division KSB1 bacterium]|nr:tyrosine--tRNA ligase [candidate division KSB1 bacterium]